MKCGNCSYIVFQADARVTATNGWMDAENGARNSDSFHRELKGKFRESVTKELRDELSDELDDVEYDEVPLEGDHTNL